MFNFTADGSLPTTPSFRWQGGEGVFVAQGDFDGGTLTLEYSLDNGTTWTAVGANTTLTASGGGVFAMSKEAYLRATLAGATAPSINASLDGLVNP